MSSPPKRPAGVRPPTQVQAAARTRKAGVNAKASAAAAQSLAPVAHASGRDLAPDDWARAALMAWGAGGYSAVAVEPLAKILGVTKGSFYWHFGSRRDLVVAALKLWERSGTNDVIADLESLADPGERLRGLFRRAWDGLEFMRVEAAMGATALTGDPDVRPAYERVQRRRLDYLTHLYDDLGFRGVEARRRAVTTYGTFLGSVQIVLLGDESLRTKAQLGRQVALFEELLIPKSALV